ncbi:delta-type opioid receptor-like [Lineus longissimus]|uniref:delta-type opioid receptor-like n=1 Tax=Lineus longissimus TaxID=88925 RepID=UPI00315D03D1
MENITTFIENVTTALPFNLAAAASTETTGSFFDEFSATFEPVSNTAHPSNVTQDPGSLDIAATAPPVVVDPYLESLMYSHMLTVRYGPPTIMFLGVLGNSLSLLVLSRQQYSKASTTWYMKILAIYDLINSFAWPGLRWTTTHYPSVAITLGDVFCKGYSFGGNWLVNTSAWILVFMTIDRMISVCKPLKASQICTIARAQKIVIGLTIVFAVFASPCFTRTMKIKQGVINRAQCPFNPAWLFDAFYYAVVVVRLWAAPLTVLFCNIAIVTALFRQRQKRATMSQTG